MNVLSLFAGIGGIDLGLERAGMTTVGQVEIDPFCQQVLAKHWPDVPKHDDVRTAIEWWDSESRPRVDVVAGGFPCTDISNAGERAGIGAERSGLWKPMFHTIRHLRPDFAIIENVAALTVRGLDVVLCDLASIGFDAEWQLVRASDFGAPHERERIFIVAYPSGVGRERGWVFGAEAESVEFEGCGSGAVWSWPVESRPVGVAYGVPDRVDRVKALGNAVVPVVAEWVGRRVLEVA